MKKILTVFMFVLICLGTNAQEVHGYSNMIAEKLNSVGFTTLKGYGMETSLSHKGESFCGSDVFYIKSYTYTVYLSTPKNYGLEQTRLTIDSLLQHRMITYDWKTKPFSDFPNASETFAMYLLGDTLICVFIIDAVETEDSYTQDYCTVALYECIIGKKTPNKKASGKSKRRSRKH